MENKVLVAGDWHADKNWTLRVLKKASEAGFKTIYHVGDLGILWPSGGGPQTPDRYSMLLDRWLREFGFESFIFAEGNHDNIDALGKTNLDDEGFGIVSEMVRHAPRGHRWTKNGVRFAACGGAVSIDRAMRVPGRTWWPEEVITPEDVQRLGSEPVDVLLTHEVSAGVQLESGLIFPLGEELAHEAYQQRLLVAEAIRNTQPMICFSGHWHQRVTQQLPGTDTVVHVLDMNGYEGNMVSLDLDSMKVSPFPVTPLR